MRRFYALIIIAYLTILGLWLILIKKSDISFIENRELSKFPKFQVDLFYTGDYSKEIELYVEDHFPYRNLIIDAVSQSKDAINFNSFSFQNQEVESFIEINKNVKARNSRTNQTISNDTSYDAIIDDPNAEFKSINGIFLYKNRGFQFFGGGNKSASRYAKGINSFKGHFPSLKKVYVLVIPSSTEFYLPPEKYKKKANSEKKNLNDIYSKLDTNVLYINIYPEMLKHRREYLYFKTDHHWTARGANIAYKSFSQIADFKPLDEKNMPIKIFNSKFIGSLYAWSKDINLNKNPDSIEYYDIPLKNTKAKALADKVKNKWVNVNILNTNKVYGNGYGIFLGMDFPFMEINGSVKNNRKLLVIKDSYANAFIPFLVNHYERIYVADIRYFPFKIDNTIKKFNINEVLFINNIVMANNPFFTKRLSKILK